MWLPAKLVAILLLGGMAVPAFATCLAMPLETSLSGLPVERSGHPASCHERAGHTSFVPPAPVPTSRSKPSPLPVSHQCCISAHQPAALGPSFSLRHAIMQHAVKDAVNPLPLPRDAQLSPYAFTFLSVSPPGAASLRI